MDVDVQDLAIFGTAVGVSRPNNAAQGFSADSWPPRTASKMRCLVGG